MSNKVPYDVVFDSNVWISSPEKFVPAVVERALLPIPIYYELNANKISNREDWEAVLQSKILTNKVLPTATEDWLTATRTVAALRGLPKISSRRHLSSADAVQIQNDTLICVTAFRWSQYNRRSVLLVSDNASDIELIVKRLNAVRVRGEIPLQWQTSKEFFPRN